MSKYGTGLSRTEQVPKKGLFLVCESAQTVMLTLNLSTDSIYGADASTSSKGKRTIALGPQQLALPQGPPREMRLYAYAGCPEAHECETGFAIADHYSFAPASICDTESGEISFHDMHSTTGQGLDVRFKSFGHEGCLLEPGLEGKIEKGLYGRLDCGEGLTGQCRTSSEEEAKAQLCVDELGDRSAVRNGTVFQMMAVCRF